MRRLWLLPALFVAFAVIPTRAQETPAPRPTEKPPAAGHLLAPPEPQSQVKVTVVVSRFQSDKKIGSLPYVMGVTTGERTSLRMGSDVPIVSRASKGGGGGGDGFNMIPSISYRTVGTSIDCHAGRASSGLYKLTLTVEDSSVHLDPDQKAGSAAVTNDYPAFRTFKTTFGALLRDGQTLQHTSATDPVSGEVMKVDVTLNVMK
jgi:hypothetical protein